MLSKLEPNPVLLQAKINAWHKVGSHRKPWKAGPKLVAPRALSPVMPSQANCLAWREESSRGPRRREPEQPSIFQDQSVCEACSTKTHIVAHHGTLIGGSEYFHNHITEVQQHVPVEVSSPWFSSSFPTSVGTTETWPTSLYGNRCPNALKFRVALNNQKPCGVLGCKVLTQDLVLASVWSGSENSNQGSTEESVTQPGEPPKEEDESADSVGEGEDLEPLLSSSAPEVTIEEPGEMSWGMTIVYTLLIALAAACLVEAVSVELPCQGQGGRLKRDCALQHCLKSPLSRSCELLINRGIFNEDELGNILESGKELIQAFKTFKSFPELLPELEKLAVCGRLVGNSIAFTATFVITAIYFMMAMLSKMWKGYWRCRGEAALEAAKERNRLVGITNQACQFF